MKPILLLKGTVLFSVLNNASVTMYINAQNKPHLLCGTENNKDKRNHNT